LLLFKQVVNSVLRRGPHDGPSRLAPFRIDARPLGLRPGIDLDRALDLAARLEDDEIERKLELRK
jgi:hypothetical protein